MVLTYKTEQAIRETLPAQEICDAVIAGLKELEEQYKEKYPDHAKHQFRNSRRETINYYERRGAKAVLDIVLDRYTHTSALFQISDPKWPPAAMEIYATWHKEFAARRRAGSW